MCMLAHLPILVCTSCQANINIDNTYQTVLLTAVQLLSNLVLYVLSMISYPQEWKEMP